MSLHCSSVLPRCVQYYVFFAVGADGCQSFPHLWGLFRDESMGAQPHRVLYPWLEISSCFPFLKTFISFGSPAHPIQQTQCAWLNPLLIVWYYGWCWDAGGPCQPCDFVTVGCCVGLTKSPAVCGRRTAETFSCTLLSWAWGSCPRLLWCFSVCFHPACPCLLSPCTTPPSTTERWGSPKSDSLSEQQHDAHHPFYLLCLSCVRTVPALSLDPQGRVFFLITKACTRAGLRWGPGVAQMTI